MPKLDFNIKRIDKKMCSNILSRWHYLTSISKGFKSGVNYGLFIGWDLCGVCIFTGFPVPELVVGMFGLERNDQDGFYELSRLCLRPDVQKSEHNLSGWFAAKCIRDLKKNNNPRAILSYADSGFHGGTVYRALNFKYYGLSAQKSDFIVDDGKMDLFGNKIVNKFGRGGGGSGGSWEKRNRKHRYLLLIDKSLELKWNECDFNNVEID